MSLNIDIGGWQRLSLEHLVLDLNGTLAVDGALAEGVADALERISDLIDCRVITADTFGTARDLFPPAVGLAIIKPGNESAQKLDMVQTLGPDKVAAMGNGANDGLMLQAAAVGIAVMGGEGAAASALAAADVVVPGPLAGLELFLNPRRLVATLRR